MKKTISFATCIVLLVMLAACGGEATPTPTPSPGETATPSASASAESSPSIAADISALSESLIEPLVPTSADTVTSAPTETPTPSETPAPTTSSAPAETAEPQASTLHHVEIEAADYGTISVELDAEQAPKTVENFLSLARSGFYDGLTFHRIMEGFMIQGGDPNGDGTGGSETNITGEFSLNEVENTISHVRGVISMARSSAYDSAGSQFFIVHEDSTFLDGQYAAFGHVTDGMEAVDAIAADAQPTDDNGTIPAEAQPVISSVKVID